MNEGFKSLLDFVSKITKFPELEGITKKDAFKIIDFIVNKVDSIIEDKNFKTFIETNKNSILEVLGLGKSKIVNLGNAIDKKTFLVGKDVMDSFRTFIVSNYEGIDLVVYKCEGENLSYHSGNTDLAVSDNINPEDLVKYLNENEALKSDGSSFIQNKIDENDLGGLASIKIKDLLLSFNKSSGSTTSDENIEKSLNEIKNLFELYNLSSKLSDKLEITYQYIDPLTGVYNSKYLQTLFEIDKRNKLKLSLIFIDLDNFKNVNDTYGHAAGDEVLKELTNIIKSSLKENDKLIRNGGDEFIVLVNSTDPKTVEEINSRIHENIENGHFICKVNECKNQHHCSKENKSACIEAKGLQVGITTGIEVFKDGDDLKTVMARADKNMLSKKSEDGLRHRVMNIIGLLKNIKILKLIRDAIDKRIGELKKEEA